MLYVSTSSTAALMVIMMSVVICNHRDPDLCVVRPSIKSPYLQPLLLTESKTRGTFSTSVTSDKREVHLVRIQIPDTNLNMPPICELDVTSLQNTKEFHSSGAVVVLETNKTIFWRVKGERLPKNVKFTLVLTNNSQLLDSPDIQWDVQRTNSIGSDLLKFLKDKFRALTSYAEVKQANYIQLNIGIVEGAPFRCNLKDLGHTPVVVGYKKMDQVMDGCIHENNMGKTRSDVYIIELISGSYFLQQALVPNVTIDLRGEGDEVIHRNITIILRCHKGVHWLVKAKNIAGKLFIISDSTVEDIEHPPELSVSISSETLPKQFDLLVLYVTTQFGAPVAYVKTQVANVFKLLISKQKTDDQISATTKYDWKKYEEDGDFTSRADTYMTDISSALEVHCENRPPSFQVTFEKSVMESYGLEPRHVTLADALCHAVSNKTHYVLVSSMDACGTNVEDDGLIFTNRVRIQTPSYPYDDEDIYEGSGDDVDYKREKSIIFQCEIDRSRPSFESLWNKGHAPNFQMDMIPKPNNIKDPQQVREITAGQPVVVTLKSLKRPGILVDKCWISNSTSITGPALLYLVRHFCPVNFGAENFASLDNERTMQLDFQLAEKFSYFGVLFLFCQVGPCTPHTEDDGDGPQCLKPHLQCVRDGLKESVVPQSTPHQEVLVSEPLKVVQGLKGANENRLSKDHSSQAVNQVLSVEVVIGIAFGSFFLGVILTALLWYIHLRTGTTKQIQDPEGEARPLRVLAQTSLPTAMDQRPVPKSR